MKTEIKLPAHLQALVNNPEVQKKWNQIQEEKSKDVKFEVTDVTPKGYGTEE